MSSAVILFNMSQSEIPGLKRGDPERRCREGDGEAVDADAADPPGWSGWFGRKDAGRHACSGRRIPEDALGNHDISHVPGPSS